MSQAKRRFLIPILSSVVGTFGCRTTVIPEAGSAALAAASAPAEPTSRTEGANASLLICEALSDLPGGTSYGLQILGSGTQKDVLMLASFAYPPFADQWSGKAQGSWTSFPSTLDIEGGGTLQLFKVGSKTRVKIQWQGRAGIEPIWEAAEDLELACDDGSGLELGPANALTAEQFVSSAKEKMLSMAHAAVKEALGGPGELLSLETTSVTAAGHCEGFLNLHYTFRQKNAPVTEAKPVSVRFNAQVHEQDCIYGEDVQQQNSN